MDTPQTNENEKVEQSVVPDTAQATPIIAETTTSIALLPQPSFFARNKANIIAVVIALGLIGGAGYYFYNSKPGNAVVAVVNGTKIYQKEFDESVALIEQNALQGGADITDAQISIEIRNQALETLINNTLIISGAQKAGLTASPEKVTETYNLLVTQNGGAEELAKRMAEIGLTEEQLQKNIRDRILADAFIEQETDIETLKIPDEEIRKVYEEVKASAPKGSEFPPFEEVRPQIEAQLLTEKQHVMMTELFAKLRTEGKIEMKI